MFVWLTLTALSVKTLVPGSMSDIAMFRQLPTWNGSLLCQFGVTSVPPYNFHSLPQSNGRTIEQ